MNRRISQEDILNHGLLVQSVCCASTLQVVAHIAMLGFKQSASYRRMSQDPLEVITDNVISEAHCVPTKPSSAGGTYETERAFAQIGACQRPPFMTPNMAGVR